ncbi:GntR family transcriptional regulator [Pseudomonas frederiksbergensis]|uniref:GntR family transcriptional regulator n=1 Tax=Pseudomonas frederiksbergensis TaxID=104087 RepID=UPI003D23C1BE
MPTNDLVARPLYEQIQADLKAAIEREEYLPDTRLPSEHALCERYDVSRSTVRQALNEMLQAGIIYKAHGRGTFVARPRPFRDVSTLEGLSEALTAQGHRVSNRLQSFRKLKADTYLAEQMGVVEGTALAELARVRLVKDKPVSYEITVCAQALGEQLLSAELSSRDILAILEDDCGLLISYADMQLKAIGATAELAELLEIPLHEPLMRIQRRVLGADSATLLYEQLYLHGENLDYHMRVERARR